MIEIKKDPRDVKKRFKCSKCDCEFTAEHNDTSGVMKYKVLGRVYGERTYIVEADSYEEAIKKGKEADL